VVVAAAVTDATDDDGASGNRSAGVYGLAIPAAIANRTNVNTAGTVAQFDRRGIHCDDIFDDGLLSAPK
jgi:hypothetical protein